MKSISRTIVCALFLFTASYALSADTSDFAAKTTRDLVKLCSVAEGDDLHGAAKGYCLGFVDAATDYHAVVTSGELLKPLTCPPGSATRGDVVDVFLAWAKKNDALLDTENPIHGLMRALIEQWPCD